MKCLDLFAGIGGFGLAAQWMGWDTIAWCKPGRILPTGKQWEEPWPEVAAKLCRVDDGVPKRLDRRRRIEQMGNSLSPILALQIFRAIEMYEKIKS